jgi:hypothetical protein
MLTPLIIDSRFGIQFRFELFQFIFDNITRYLTVWVIEVTKHPNPCHTGRHTGRFFTLLNKFNAETTFLNITFFFNNPDIIRTSGNAIFATYAFILIHKNHSIFSLVGGSGGTNLHTGRVITMLALDWSKFTCIVGKSPVFSFFEMIIGLLFLKAILVMAGHSAGVTTHAFRFVDHHSISRHCFLSHLSLIFPLTPCLPAGRHPSPPRGEGKGEG